MGRKGSPNLGNQMFFESGMENNKSYNKYFFQLLNLASSVFEWENMPDSVDTRFLELGLCTTSNASMLFSHDKDMVVNNNDEGYVVTRWSYAGDLNIYGIPRKRQAYAVNTGYYRTLDDTNSVIIWDNKVRYPAIQIIKYFSDILWDLDQTVKVNCLAQKTPVMIETTKEGKLTALNAFKQWRGNAPLLLVKKNTMGKEVEFNALSTNAPFVANDIYDLMRKRWNECLTDLGIRNMNIGKKERLVQDEARNSLGDTNNILQNKLQERKTACNQINKMFGLNIDVKVNENILAMAQNIDITQLVESGLDLEGDTNE